MDYPHRQTVMPSLDASLSSLWIACFTNYWVVSVLRPHWNNDHPWLAHLHAPQSDISGHIHCSNISRLSHSLCLPYTTPYRGRVNQEEGWDKNLKMNFCSAWICFDYANPPVLKLKYSWIIKLIPILLMTWLIASPGHQQPWYWLCKIHKQPRRTNFELWYQNIFSLT